MSFYKEKTEKRVFQYFSRFRVPDKEERINDVQVPKLSDLLDKIDWDLLSEGKPTRYHGDLHFENILVAENGEFWLLDWRQNFAGLKDYGDVYYDLAKLYHGIIVSHELVNKNYFNIKREGEVVTFDILRNHKLTEAEKLFENFIIDQGLDLYKVKLLTALIFLNIAPLHHYPYSEFLFYLGKYQLNELINKL
jgi:thiamine kinase-like enzyme